MTDEEYEAVIDGIGTYILSGQPLLAHASLLHVMMHDGSFSFNLFDDMGTEVVYRLPSYPLPWDLLQKLHLGQPAERRWSELEYFLAGANFNLKFLYADEVGFDRESLEIRDKLLSRYFGNKPVRYPPFPGEDENPFYTGNPDGSWRAE